MRISDWSSDVCSSDLAHVLAVFQPSVPCYAAAAVMAASKHKCRPRTLTMMGGPIDTRKAPTAVNQHATTRPYAWFQETVIAPVPDWYPGAGRRVSPRFLQLAVSMAMNLGKIGRASWRGSVCHTV